MENKVLEILKKIKKYGACYNNTVSITEIIDLIEGQQAEIERLTKENERLSIKVWNYEKPVSQPVRIPLYSDESMVNCNLVTCYNENADLKAKNTELQKQVEELKILPASLITSIYKELYNTSKMYLLAVSKNSADDEAMNNYGVMTLAYDIIVRIANEYGVEVE